MPKLTGNVLLGQALRRQGADTMFYIMGGPINDALLAAMGEGVRGIDVRHEQAAAMMAHAYGRVRLRPGVCLGASGPGTINLVTGLANALVDCAPVVALGGASPIGSYLTGSFQEIDQLAIMRPVTKWAERVYETHRIPEYVDLAFRHAMAGRPGPVYLDLPGDVLYREVDETRVAWPRSGEPWCLPRACADRGLVAHAMERLARSERPIVLAGSGVLWSDAAQELQAFIEATGIPFYTTPQSRGVVPEDHPCFFGQARSTAFRDADFVLVVGTRLNYVFGHGEAPRFAADALFVRIDTDPAQLASSSRPDIDLLGDARAVLEQLTAEAGSIGPARFSPWRDRLATIEAAKRPASEARLATDQVPIHPLRLCKEIRDFIGRDTILCVDGQEILNFGRQSIPTHRAGHRLNSGTFGTMGVGLPFGIGAKAARPDQQVVVLHGDGSFGLNGMELDTAVRHNLPLLVVISLNGGWTGDPEKKKPGRDLGYTRYDRMAQALGCFGAFVDRPEEIRPALERAGAAVANGQTALVNVVTDWRAVAGGASFTNYRT